MFFHCGKLSLAASEFLKNLSAMKCFLLNLREKTFITSTSNGQRSSKGEQVNATDFNLFKAYLVEQKSSILNKSNEFKSEQAVEKSSFSDEAEAASVDLSMSLSIHLHERDRRVLMQIERALGKIEDGSYGHCESCSEMIGISRLKASPFTTLCIACKEEQEDKRNFLQ